MNYYIVKDVNMSPLVDRGIYRGWTMKLKHLVLELVATSTVVQEAEDGFSLLYDAR